MHIKTRIKHKCHFGVFSRLPMVMVGSCGCKIKRRTKMKMLIEIGLNTTGCDSGELDYAIHHSELENIIQNETEYNNLMMLIDNLKKSIKLNYTPKGKERTERTKNGENWRGEQK